VCVCIHTYLVTVYTHYSVYVCVCIRTHTHTYIYIYTHKTHTHIHTAVGISTVRPRTHWTTAYGRDDREDEAVLLILWLANPFIIRKMIQNLLFSWERSFVADLSVPVIKGTVTQILLP